MGNKGKVIKARFGGDRNRIAGPWQPLMQFEVPPQASEAGIAAMFQNNRYVVYVKTNVSTEFKRPNGTPSTCVHLIIARHDKQERRTWGDLQRIKNEVCGPLCEAVEVFPSEVRRLDIPNHQTHLWVYEPSVILPHGLVPKEMHAAHHARRAIESIPLDERTVVAVFKTVDGEGGVRVRQPVEVYADDAEARAVYGDRLDDKTDDHFAARVCGIDQIPPPDFETPEDAPGATWTDAARARHAAFVERMLAIFAPPEDAAEALEREMEALPDGPVGDEEAAFSGAAEAAEREEAAAASEEAARAALEGERERLRAERKAREGQG